MVIRKPFMVLVCLAIVAALPIAAQCLAQGRDGFSASPGVEAEVLSADPTYKAPKPTRSAHPPRSETFPRSKSGYAPRTAHPQYTYPRAHSGTYAARPAAVLPPGSPRIPSVCSLTGLPLGPLNAYSFLPRARNKQFHFRASLWYVGLNSTTILWGTNLAGGEGTELDLNRDLDLDKHRYLSEYEASFQIRDNWAIRYSFMPIQYERTSVIDTPGGFYFGNWLFVQGQGLHAKWDRLIHRWDLVYRWFNQAHAESTIFGGYSLYDDRLSLSSNVARRTRSKGFGLAFGGMGIDKVIGSTAGAGQASLHCKWSVQFLEGYFGWDGYAGGRLAVPFNCGRFGYLEAGWRWIVLNRDEGANVDQVNMDGLIGSVGVVF